MENAYNLGMKIADEVAGEEIIRVYPRLKGKTFSEVKNMPNQSIPDQILELHRSIFEKSFKILSETKV